MSTTQQPATQQPATQQPVLLLSSTTNHSPISSTSKPTVGDIVQYLQKNNIAEQDKYLSHLQQELSK
jgi:hypothetical protein